MTEPTKLLLSVKDVIDATNLGRTRLYELFKSGDLPFVKVGGRTFVRPADLGSFVERLTPHNAA